MNKMDFDIENALISDAKTVEERLCLYFDEACPELATIFEAQKYSLLGGGKRIRPYLVLAFCRMFGGNADHALSLACAIEMIHTYSLIHDDLPCMDNDDYRRGKLTNHKVYGEATAVLAGDALLTKAFEIVASARGLSSESKVCAIEIMATSAGDRGMIGGQTMDMGAQNMESTDLPYLLKMHSMKTGALIRASAKLGCVAAGIETGSAEMVAAECFADKIGLAFQIVDDMLDVIGDATVLGKNVGVDRASGKLTFTNFYTVEQAEHYAAQLTDEAIHAIEAYDSRGELRALALYLLQRKK